MDLSPLESMMAKLSAWRECEAAAQADVEDAETRAIAADIRVNQARQALKAAQFNAAIAQQQIAEFVMGNTTPCCNYASVGNDED